MSIRILPDFLISQIAAGEVVERPSSVVKELVENSIDAKARNIQIYIEDGGKKSITVIDDGIGMSPEELPLAFERHATSKLPSADLFAINTFGFRGEALPSIASVSKVQIISKRATDEHASMMTIEAGKKSEVKPVAAPNGTKIVVEDLFYAIPARLKFLKSTPTELSNIIDYLTKVGLANPNVNFRLYHNGKSIMDMVYLNDSPDPHDMLAERVKSQLTHEFMENALWFSEEMANTKIYGYVSLPTYNKPTSAQHFFFVNKRPIRDKNLIYAVRSAYNDVLTKERYPAVVLFIEMPNEEVDINVHPAKIEVRFLDEKNLKSNVIRTINKALASATHRTSTILAKDLLANLNQRNIKKDEVSYNQENSSYEEFGLREESKDIPHPADRAFMKPDPIYKPRDVEIRPFERPNYELREFKPSVQADVDTAQNLNYQMRKEEVAPTQLKMFGNEVDYHELPLGKAIGCLYNTYIVAESKEGLVIIDQHAAHERIVYEGLKKDSSVIEKQNLLMPEVINFGSGDASILLENLGVLNDLGIIIEQFGSNKFLVRALPAILGQKIEVEKLIRDIVDILKDGQDLPIMEKINEVRASMACHGSVRAGRKLNLHEMDSLLRTMEQTALSGECNHGRPTSITISQSKLEKMFDRK